MTKSAGCSIWWAPPNWRAARCCRCREASASAFSSPRRCSDGRGWCCSTSRSSASIPAGSRTWWNWRAGCANELGATVLFSAHEVNPLLGAIDRVLYLANGQAALGPVDEVITGPVLSRLYGAEIEVVRLGSRIFVMSGVLDVANMPSIAMRRARHA